MGIVEQLEADLSKEIVGSKACNLSLLIKNGFNVPKGFVISNFDNNKNIVKAKIKDMLNSLDDDYFAVRSSANVEDSGHYSFAGIFDSYLNVKKKATIRNYI